MSKKHFQAALLLLLFFLLPLRLFAAYQENVPQRVVQPDGSVLELLASGDEFFNYLHDDQGYTVISGKDGFYYYAIKVNDQIVASDLRVGQHDPRSLGLQKRLFISPDAYRKKVEDYYSQVDPAAKAPHTGSMVNLVIYIRFSDEEEFTTPRSTFDNYFNQAEGPSLRHYFQEVSYGQLDIESHHFPVSEMTVNLSYQATQPRAYYQPASETNTIGYDPDIPTSNGSNPNGRTYREHSLLVAAVLNLTEQIPTTLNLDGDGDGRVDNVSFILKGQQDGWNDLLWAHRWSLWSQVVNIRGKRVYDYTFQPQTQSSVNVLCHEMFHALGAPDLYHYSDNGFTPVGPWDLMHSGFVHMGAYMKWKYAGQQWISDIPTISDPGTYTLNPLLVQENNAYRINSINSDNEFFIVEYRKRSGHYETNIPGEGLLVYRINPEAGNGNASGPPDEIYLYRLDGSVTSNGNIFQAYFSEESGRTEFSDDTNPSSFLSGNLPADIYISNISSAGETISFDLMPAFDDVFPPNNLIALVNEDNAVELNWELPDPPAGEGDPILLGFHVYRKGLIHDTVVDPEIFSYLDETAPAGTVTYYVRAFYEGDLVSAPTNVASVNVPSYLMVDGETTYDVGNNSGNQKVAIRSNLSQWSVNASQGWVDPYPGVGSYSRNIYLYYDSNPSGTPRQTSISISGSGFSEIITLRQGYSVSVDDQDTPGFRIFPNPSQSGYLMLQMGQASGKAQLRLYDLTGRQMIDQALDAQPGQTVRISTEGLPAGLYLVEVFSHEGVFREKVILR
ncbi:MAG: M6 family metalloprotease domain-containing protein [Bacteroides sp.]|jgi:M6 family metalloprotease-like protein|nr:M6 family metalloprotease domain-containing protein [Bacteroides sp.]